MNERKYCRLYGNDENEVQRFQNNTIGFIERDITPPPHQVMGGRKVITPIQKDSLWLYVFWLLGNHTDHYAFSLVSLELLFLISLQLFAVQLINSLVVCTSKCHRQKKSG